MGRRVDAPLLHILICTALHPQVRFDELLLTTIPRDRGPCNLGLDMAPALPYNVLYKILSAATNQQYDIHT